MPPLQLFDSSVLIPWLRTRHYDALVTTAFATRRFLLSTVVWMELYAGTRGRGDKQDLDRMVRALTEVGRVVSPEPEDFYTAGQVVAMYTRRYGQIALRDHAQDILIALGAWRTRAELFTVNRQDMDRWQGLLRRAGKRITVSFDSFGRSVTRCGQMFSLGQKIALLSRRADFKSAYQLSNRTRSTREVCPL